MERDDTMRNRYLWTFIGLGTLSVALIALPGSSARTQDPKNSLNILQARIQELEERAKAQAPGSPLAQVLDEMQEIEEPAWDDDQDVHVLLSTGGSWLGVGITEVTAAKVKELKLPAERGALLGKVVPEGPAAKAGLKENDVVTEVNGQRVEGTEQFRRMIREIPAGRAAQLTVWRDGRAQTISVTMGASEAHHPRGMIGAPGAPGAFVFGVPDLPERPEVWGMDDFNNFVYSPLGQPRLGIDAENLGGGDFGNYFGAPDGQGVLVREVFTDSPAAKAGLKVADVIISVDGQRIRTVKELRGKLAEKKDDKSLKLGLLRNKGELSLTVEFPPSAQKQPHHISQRTNL
jgi:serine protease Do